MNLLHSKIIGEGPAFIILHGFLGMGDNWKTLGSQFSALGYQVHLIDQRNHGRSFHDDMFSYEILVEDLKLYCEVKELDSFVLLGHSMGGKTAMFFAATYPEMISKLIVADIAPRFYPRHHQDILAGLHALDFDNIKSRLEAEAVLLQYVTHYDTRQFLLKNLYWKEKGRLGLRINLDVLTENIDEIAESLAEYMTFDGETLFLKGDRSEYISAQDELHIKRQFSNVRIQTVSNAGHWLHAENPVEFVNLVSKFLN